MEYIGQNLKDKDCVIVGIYNALRWLNRNISYKKVEYFARNYYKYTPEDGFTLGENLANFMKCWEITPTFMERLDLAESHILSGNAAVAIIRRKGEKLWHMIFLKPESDRTITVINNNCEWIDLVLDFRKKELEMVIWNIGNQKDYQKAA